MSRWVFLLFVVPMVNAGCERAHVTPAIYLDDLQVNATPVGLDVSFVLLDRARMPTIVMFGAGVIRVEDRPDSIASPTVGDGALSDSVLPASSVLDSTWLLYNARFFVSREYFARERRDLVAEEGETDVCRMGVYPYRHFLRKPSRPDGVVRVAFVAVDGKHVMLAEQRVVWPEEAFADEVGAKEGTVFGSW